VTFLLLFASFVLIVAGAFFFTNAVEWAGLRLGLAHGAVGSLLAAVATALPESVIPVIALIKGGSPEQQEIAIGAIIGAPFLLGTLAMAIVGFSAHAFRKRREQAERITPDVEHGQRDFAFFVGFFALALVLGAIGVPSAIRIGVAIVFVIAYVVYTVWTVRGGQEAETTEPDAPLFFDWTKDDPPNNFQLIAQLALSIAAIIGGAELFVHEVEAAATAIGVPLMVLALVLAPLATELPEKANSVLWLREGKDDLAIGNITGAMVFQATIPVAVGLAFTDWQLDGYAVLAGSIAIAGGLVAYWSLDRRRRFAGSAILAWCALFVLFAASVLLLS
jgi:cation:H+ antiporter